MMSRVVPTRIHPIGHTIETILVEGGVCDRLAPKIAEKRKRMENEIILVRKAMRAGGSSLCC